MTPSLTPQRVTGRVIAVTLLAAVLVGAMTWLGLWQLGVYDDRQHDDAESALERDPIPLDEALGPDEAFPADAVGRPVTTSGTYVADEQFYVRDLEGASETYAVVTPLLTSSGSAILVVRGSSPTPDAAPPAGPVELEGILEPSMAEGSALDASRTTDGIRISVLVSSFSQDLYGGYLVARTSTPPESLTPVEPPLADPSRWAGIRNLLYAVQWWVFAAFVIFMWWRILTEKRPDAT